MCGIIGIVGKDAETVASTNIEAMLSCLKKRGPDEQKFQKFDNCVLGHTRLSIIDISGGHQPMRDNALPLAVVFNGEIYNYKELRAELESKGHIFSTHSDTEVILKTYAEYGSACPNKLDGMFAFAIWDEEKGQLFMARDRFGKKPFYYAQLESGSLIFASEARSILASNLIAAKIDWGAIDNYLKLMYIPPRKTVYSNIHTLPPAHSALYDYSSSTISTRIYWTIPDRPIHPTYAEAKTKIKDLLDKAVEKRMLAADVEVGSLLSGGVDSTLVSYLAQKHLKNPLKTFSIGYEDHINELPYAAEAAKRIGSDHYTDQATPNLTQELHDIISYMDEPHADSSNIAQYLVSNLAASKVKVALSGDGADELFMGYGWYWKYRNHTKLRQINNALFSNPFKEHLKLVSVFSDSERKKLWKDTPPSINITGVTHPHQKDFGTGTRAINYYDLTTYLPGQLLSKVDRLSMMNSLEVRSPFLDKDLAEYVFNLPQEYKTDAKGKKGGKIILKDILAEIMPQEFVYRRKQGFGAPVLQWIKIEPMKSFMYKHLADDEALIYTKLRREHVMSLLSDFYEHGNDGAFYKLWSLLCLEIWLKTHR
jgi:asparagine synthase (glutamine-hydrolysing)